MSRWRARAFAFGCSRIRIDDLPAYNSAFERTAGSHSLAAAAHRDVRPSGKGCGSVIDVGGSGMLSDTLAALLKLPAKDRIELAMALWDSLTDAEREAELDRRLAEHLANPGSAIPWEEVRRKLASGA